MAPDLIFASGQIRIDVISSPYYITPKGNPGSVLDLFLLESHMGMDQYLLIPFLVG